MTADELVIDASPRIYRVGQAFYFVPETLARGRELGLDGFRFYFLGRGGVLGDVEARVVSSAFGYFKPELVARMWDSARETMDPRDGGRQYVRCAQQFGRRRFGDLDLADFCDAAARVNAAADPTALALYAAISAEPLAEDPPARAMQLVTMLREYRGGVHLVALRAHGVAPLTAHHLRRPDDLGKFGWEEGEAPDVSEEERARYEAAEALTDRLVAPAYRVLDGAGGRALISGLEAMEAALAG